MGPLGRADNDIALGWLHAPPAPADICVCERERERLDPMHHRSAVVYRLDSFVLRECVLRCAIAIGLSVYQLFETTAHDWGNCCRRRDTEPSVSMSSSMTCSKPCRTFTDCILCSSSPNQAHDSETGAPSSADRRY